MCLSRSRHYEMPRFAIIDASKIGRDIAQQKLIDAERREADRRKDEFLAMLAHELRNLLASINNAVQLFGACRDNRDQKFTRLRDGLRRPFPGFTVTPTSRLTTTEGGGTATFNVALNAPPTGNATITVATSDASEGTASASSLTFTSSNWSTPQTVTITGVDDSVYDQDIAYTIVLSAAVSNDASYHGLNPLMHRSSIATTIRSL